MIPLNILQKWVGHTEITATAVYTKILEEEEEAIAALMWKITDDK